MAKLNEIDLVNYVINNGATLKDAADYFNVSLSTVKKMMKKIKEELNEDTVIYRELKENSKNNELLGKQKGGQALNTGIKRTFSLEQISLLAMELIANNMTLDLASEKFKIPKSTLWDNFNLLNCEEYLELYNDLLYIYKCHNEGVDNNIVLDPENRTLNDSWLKSLQQKNIITLEGLMQKYTLKLEEYATRAKK